MDRTQQIIDIVAKVSKRPGQPEFEESLFDSGYLDSFALPDLLAELEGEFVFTIPDSDLNPAKFESIERIDRYVARALADRKA